jgi:hypothetical protein
MKAGVHEYKPKNGARNNEGAENGRVEDDRRRRGETTGVLYRERRVAGEDRRRCRRQSGAVS